MLRSECANCGCADLKTFLDLGQTPLADAFMATPDENPTKYDLSLLVCPQCYLVHLSEIVPDELLFNHGYTFYSSTSPPIQRYHREYADEMIRWFPEQGQRLTVEIASNDGSLLQHLMAQGWPTLGIDPAGGPSQIAADHGLDIITQPFSRELAEQVRISHGQAGLIIANNVLAHVQDPNDFLKGVAELLHPDGAFVLEVQYLGDLLAGNMFDHVYHEHRFYFSLDSVTNLLNRAGLKVWSVRRTQPQGGSLRVVAIKGKDSRNSIYDKMASEQWLRQPETYESFQGRIGHIKTRLMTLLFEQGAKNVAGYGATAKSTTLLNTCGLDSNYIQYIVDTTPAKVGKYTPGTRIPIISPEQEQERGYPDLYLLLAWNYLGAILRKSDLSQDRSTKWLVPIPLPIIL